MIYIGLERKIGQLESLEARLTAIAHVRKETGTDQMLKEHLLNVSTLTASFAQKIGCKNAGTLLGLLHDFGKYSQEFQNYLRSATGKLNQDEDEEFVDAKSKKGKVDHSTAGAQWIYREYSSRNESTKFVAEIISLAIASHHSGLIDCLSTNKFAGTENNFGKRIEKPDVKTHLNEVLDTADQEIISKMEKLIADNQFEREVILVRDSIISKFPDRKAYALVSQLKIGLFARFLFSCLIDADRQDSADFENPDRAGSRQNGNYANWDTLLNHLNTYLATLTPRNSIDEIRKDISNQCLNASLRKKGLFTLTVPTGGGKTLASLRFALAHAKEHNLERIIYVIPFTSIIDQNADATRSILDPEGTGNIVLEHHSNLEPEVLGWKNKILSENWDAPIIYTTTVQVLEALFGSGTRGARRMHQLANSVIIFDEIQTMPIKCIHLFNNAINFLIDHCGSTVVFCSATQPLLGDTKSLEPRKGVANLTADSEIIADVPALFNELKRVQVNDLTNNTGWRDAEIADLALQKQNEAGSCLVIVNTKMSARSLFQLLHNRTENVFHLSTGMCPVHRRKILSTVRELLSQDAPVICISTQLIEAGVDVDFGAVIRFLAGLDSIAQAAGRCNRNGRKKLGTVSIVNPQVENINLLPDIKTGRDKSQRVLQDFRDNPEFMDNDLLSPKAMTWYYQNYFYAQKEEMVYKIDSKVTGRDDSLLNLLSVNQNATGDYLRAHKRNAEIMKKIPHLVQAFMTANNAFQVIDAPTKSVIVPYGVEGRNLIGDLSAAFMVEKQFQLLHKSQQFSVNIFPHEFENLSQINAIYEVQESTGIYYLDERFYHDFFGLSNEPVAEEELKYV